MKHVFLMGVTLTLGCAALQPPTQDPVPSTIPISVRSHNKHTVDVYLLCGDTDAQLLGTLQAKDNQVFEIPVSQAHCVSGLNFFLVSREQNRGYWVGPFSAGAGSSVELVIEKYAGLSTASSFD